LSGLGRRLGLWRCERLQVATIGTQPFAVHRHLGDAGLALPEGLNRQIYLGDDDFVAHMQSLAAGGAATSKSVPKAQRTKPRDLVHWLGVCGSREEALRCAHVDSGISMTALAAELGLSVARVGQLVARAEAAVREHKQAPTTDAKAGATASGMKPS
jgi:hypothetical protein